MLDIGIAPPKTPIEPLPNAWQAGLSTLLMAETEQGALDIAVETIAELFDGPAAGVLKTRTNHLTSLATHREDMLLTPLLTEARWAAGVQSANTMPAHASFQERRIVSLLLHTNDRVIGAISTFAGAASIKHDSPYITILDLAVARTLQRIHRLAETQLLYEISLRLGSTLDLPALLHELLGLITRTFVAESSRIFLYDERASDLTMIFGPKSASENPISARVALQGSVAGWVIEHGVELIRNSQPPDSLPTAEQEIGMAAGKLICVPLKHSGRTVGALMLANRLEDADFHHEDLYLLTTIAGTIAMIITNARLYQRAIRDTLTGAYNRGAFDTMLHEYWAPGKTPAWDLG